MPLAKRPEELYDLLVQGREPRRMQAGEVIFNEGDEGDAMFIVTDGTVALKNGDRVVDRITAPALFGELALIENDPRALTAVADTDIDIYAIPARHFWVLLRDTPYFAQLVMHEHAQRLRRLSKPS